MMSDKPHYATSLRSAMASLQAAVGQAPIELALSREYSTDEIRLIMDDLPARDGPAKKISSSGLEDVIYGWYVETTSASALLYLSALYFANAVETGIIGAIPDGVVKLVCQVFAETGPEVQAAYRSAMVLLEDMSVSTEVGLRIQAICDACKLRSP